MVNRILASLWCAALMVNAACAVVGETDDAVEKTEVLVVGTVHSQHSRNPNYTYEDVVHILNAYDPDAVCVEIRPQEFRKEPYLREMMLATVWGVVHGRELCAFDWFDGSARAARSKLEALPEYIEKARLFDSLTASNPITRDFDEEYGDFWSGQHDFRFYNGRDYNRYIEETYRISLAVYGDSPINLHYELRNRRMMDLAWEVIRQHPGGKVVLLTGSEHKHYFDRDIAARGNAIVVQLGDLLPLDESPMHPAISAFLGEENDLLYYESGYPSDTNRYFQNKLVGLIHGPDMDWRPDIIPAGNIEIAGKVLRRWRESQLASHRMNFDEAWYEFLNGNCEEAIRLLSYVADAVEQDQIDDPFVQVYTYRNLGLCYDLLGERQTALRSYGQARVLMQGTRMERTADLSLRDYETVPYRRGRTAEPLGQ